MDPNKIKEKYKTLNSKLISEMNQHGYWTGRLSTSALSTAVAIVALKVAGNRSDTESIRSGYYWLCQNINTDGGFGDTPESKSNVSTTLLCYSALAYCQENNDAASTLRLMENWLASKGISIEAENITRSILKFYGRDYTFSIPILAMLTLCEVIPASSLNKIPVLPFELTLLPASWYRFMNLRVVSYALPALIAVGIYLHKHRKKGILQTGLLRSRFIKPALKKLNQLVPFSGGFLEAIPLTGFVAMCLTASGYENNATVTTGLRFLRIQKREDGGWPIDTDLSTWVTTLSVKSLGPRLKETLNDHQIKSLKQHLLQLQYKTIHPFNQAKPGGWGWTSFSGSVPDADDTPGAILAILEMYTGKDDEIKAIQEGCTWLTELQNRDGGFPTFCKGWGKLPFDKSCADLTGHALLALLKTMEILHDNLPLKLLKRIKESTRRALKYLTGHQDENGAWLPLWFGNQDTGDQSNPVYGTAKVCTYLKDTLSFKQADKKIIQQIGELVIKAQQYLLTQQNADGSWGGKRGVAGTIEETSLSVCALSKSHEESRLKAVEWLINREKITAAPIGLYFAMLWYDEKLYPLIYFTEALRRYIDDELF